MAESDDIVALLRSMQTQIDLTFRAVCIIGKGLPEMSELTDKLKALAAADAKKIATLAGLNHTSNTTLAEVLPAFQANSDALSGIIDAHMKAHAPANDDSQNKSVTDQSSDSSASSTPSVLAGSSSSTSDDSSTASLVAALKAEPVVEPAPGAIPGLRPISQPAS